MKALSESQRRKINDLMRKLDGEKTKHDFTGLFEFLVDHKKDLDRYERAICSIEDKCNINI